MTFSEICSLIIIYNCCKVLNFYKKNFNVLDSRNYMYTGYRNTGSPFERIHKYA